MDQLLKSLRGRFPQLKFTAGDTFFWSPETNEIIYNAAAGNDPAADWSLLHETGHALLEHRSYKGDFELLRLEIDAWQRAQALSGELGCGEIDQEHIEDCLDTYRDWLYKRSICPQCNTKCLQDDDFAHYRCFNCHAVWRVSASRFCRAYRKRAGVPQLEKSPL